MEDRNILNFLEDQGMINLDDVRNMMEKEKRQSIIAKHEFSIFQDKDGRWKTTIRDDTKKSGRRLIARKNKEDLENFIIDYIGKELEVNSTIRDIYLPWLKSRQLEANSINTVKRNALDWKRFYDNDPIVDIPIIELTCQQLKDWAHKKIRDNNFTKKQYYNMIVIMNKCFEYAKDSGIIEHNQWKEVKVNTKLLRKNSKKSNESQIYFYDEKIKLVSYALSRFNENHKNFGALAIPLMFLTGMRIGEVAALKYEDIKENEILISRSEVTDYEMYEDGTFKYTGVKVVEHAKTDAGERSIPYTYGAKQIINLIQEASKQFGFYDDGYVFCPNSKRIKSNSIDVKIYDYCEKLGIPKKSAHKIRKTFISQMVNSGIDIDTVCRISGHTDMSTTFNSYTYSLTKKSDRIEEFQNVYSDLNEVINV